MFVSTQDHAGSSMPNLPQPPSVNQLTQHLGRNALPAIGNNVHHFSNIQPHEENVIQTAPPMSVDKNLLNQFRPISRSKMSDDLQQQHLHHSSYNRNHTSSVDMDVSHLRPPCTTIDSTPISSSTQQMTSQQEELSPQQLMPPPPPPPPLSHHQPVVAHMHTIDANGHIQPVHPTLSLPTPPSPLEDASRHIPHPPLDRSGSRSSQRDTSMRCKISFNTCKYDKYFSNL